MNKIIDYILIKLIWVKVLIKMENLKIFLSFSLFLINWYSLVYVMVGFILNVLLELFMKMMGRLSGDCVFMVC